MKDRRGGGWAACRLRAAGWAALWAPWGLAGLPGQQWEGRPISLFSVSRSLLPSFSWFEFFSPFRPLHAIFPSTSAIRHEVMVMVIGGGQGGGRRRPAAGGRGAPWTESGEHAVPGVCLVGRVCGGGGGDPRQPVTLLVPSGDIFSTGGAGPIPSHGAPARKPEKSSGPFGCPFAPSGSRTTNPGHRSPSVLPGPPASSSSGALAHLRPWEPQDLAHPSEDESACWS